MTPKERINAIRLMEKMKHHPEFGGRIGVEISFVSISAESDNDLLGEDKTT